MYSGLYDGKMQRIVVQWYDGTMAVWYSVQWYRGAIVVYIVVQ